MSPSVTAPIQVEDIAEPSWTGIAFDGLLGSFVGAAIAAAIAYLVARKQVRANNDAIEKQIMENNAAVDKQIEATYENVRRQLTAQHEEQVRESERTAAKGVGDAIIEFWQGTMYSKLRPEVEPQHTVEVFFAAVRGGVAAEIAWRAAPIKDTTVEEWIVNYVLALQNVVEDIFAADPLDNDQVAHFHGLIIQLARYTSHVLGALGDLRAQCPVRPLDNSIKAKYPGVPFQSSTSDTPTPTDFLTWPRE